MNITVNSENTSETEVFSQIFTISWRVPGAISPDQAMAEIASTNTLSDEEHAKARSFLDRLVSKRRDRISRAWKITGKRTVCDTLPDYDPSWQEGLTFISAPMGSGKSAHIAAPFIRESMGRRYTVASTPSKALCHEQAAKFGVDLYSDLTKPDGYASSAMSVCLPSLDKPALQEHIGLASAFVMDEWSQSLAMLASRGVCNEGDFDKLARICSTLDAGIFADAFMSDFDIQFVTSLIKPGTPVRVFEVKNQDQGFRAKYTYGPSAREWITQEVLAEMDRGGKAWVSCEGRRSSQTIGEILQADGYRVLIVNKLTKDTPEVQAFLANAEDQCLQYDAVIHSPTITSGMSIAGEKHGQHFTRGFFLGGGWRLQPTVCAQMLRRVRYLKDWSIGIAPNNSAQTVSNASEEQQIQEIEEMTGQRVAGREAFIRAIEHRDINQRADFASAMVWLLEDMRFQIDRVPCSVSGALTDRITKAAAIIDATTQAAIIAAPVLTDEEITELQRSPVKTPADHHALIAADIRKSFSVETLTPEIVSFYDEGRGVARARRFANVSGLEFKDTRPDRALNDDVAIQRGLYQYLFDGIDLLGTITKDIAETVLDRIMARRFTLAVFGCVPSTFARITEKSTNRRVAVREDKNGHICEFQRPKYAVQVLGEVLDMMGLKSEKAKQPGSNGKRSREYVISDASLALMRSISHAHIAPLSYSITTHVCADQAPAQTMVSDVVPANDDDAMSLTEQPVVSAAAIASLQEIAARFRGLKCSTHASVWVAGHEVILPVPDCVAATAPREIMLDGVPVMWPWDWDVSEELLDMAQSDGRSYAFQIGKNVCLFSPKQGAGSPEEIIRALRAADMAA